MITKQLYKEILIKPFKEKKAEEIFIVSGYVSATFIRKHIEDLNKITNKYKINLVIGMGFKNDQHLALINLCKNYKKQLDILYFNRTPFVHSKIYIYTKGNLPFLGYSGSANYSQFGFFEEKQQNQMTADDPKELFNYFQSSRKLSKSINNFSFKFSKLFDDILLREDIQPGSIQWEKPNEVVRISFLTKKGQLAMKSGLNWGQRDKRERNQAYLPIRVDANKENFLPNRGFTFTLLTDDGETLDCTVQQDSRKAISTTYTNSILGKYIRKRLNVPYGKMIDRKDLIKYGRTDFLLKKIDDETFLFDMSVKE